MTTATTATSDPAASAENLWPGVPTMRQLADRLAARQAEAKRRMAAAFAAWVAIEDAAQANGTWQEARLLPGERDAAFAYRAALDAYAALMPPVRDLAPAEVHLALAVADEAEIEPAALPW